MLPRVVIHSAVSADGRFDRFAPDIGLFYSLTREWAEDATLAGSRTMMTASPPDEELEEVAPPEPPSPDDPRALLAVVDSRGQVRTWRTLRASGYWKDMVALVSELTPAAYLDYLRRIHVPWLTHGIDRVDLRGALEDLNDRYGVEVVRVDAGGTLNGALLRAGLVDEVSILMHPVLVGGESPRSMFAAPDLETDDGVIPLVFLGVEEHGDGIVRLRYEVVR